jgi:hypothetical protein
VLGAAVGFDAGPGASVWAGAAVATFLLLLALATGRSTPIPFALLLLGATYAIPHGDRAVAAPIYGAALLLTAELAYWSLDERVRQRMSPGIVMPRLLAILTVTAAAIPAGTLVLLAAEADVARSPWLTAAGAVAVVTCVGVLAALARLRGGAAQAIRPAPSAPSPPPSRSRPPGCW